MPMAVGGTFDFLDAALRDRVAMTVVDGTGSRPIQSWPAWPMTLFMSSAPAHVRPARGPVGHYGWLAHDALRNALLWTAGHGRDVASAVGGRGPS